MATKTRYTDRLIPQISLHDFDSRIDEITSELIHAAENVGFFTVIDHGLSNDEIESMFSNSQRFFDLPDEVKATVPWSSKNVGWEKNAQVRPSTGMPDTKESYQLQFGENMNDVWIDESHLPGFKTTSLEFMYRVQGISEKLMRCFARGLAFPEDFFIKAHDVSRPNSQTVCRLLHYFALPEESDGKVYHRAGAHADWDFLTLLFQKAGQSGLEICPGREVVTEFGIGDLWTKIEPKTGEIAPSEPGDYYGDRYSIAFFNQPFSDATIQGPLKKYPMVTGQQFTANAMKRNFAALQEKLKSIEAAA
ncbi:leucoanthocyanidin dioxygenase, putative [Talaromyces stipitatus ATCC 10500]|uniref:Leucoanthocyanidin dioxygenase, putative n=1 Tax=Talaromyces stipitatus (strain ATCC 10500 / CBS 375.48 / QM 6759 / NRRL 1006) TaxID=441959 RepID=B8MM75_TALSN|nr:leucoanthocyanidin dioxygenase, putative [Talaromyces stipitatus ATCC 10500]EED13587.1 leucoanthocyanidin dioxygenase, putative [Talaromyces stipitatus ATCC 10500]